MIRTSFDADWYVQKEGIAASKPAGPITLPHDAMFFEERDPNLPNGFNTGFFPGGTYRYTKELEVPRSWEGQAIVLEFEGVYHRSEVYVNGNLVGGRPSGYTVFTVEIEDFLEFGARNRIEVVAKNDDLPNSRWYSGSGIYRPVHLLRGGSVRIAPNGVWARTMSLEGSSATVQITTEVINSSLEDQEVTVATNLRGPSGLVTGPLDVAVVLEPGETRTVVQSTVVANAALWSDLHPSLYDLDVSARVESEVVDGATLRTGIRMVDADPKRGLRVNGKTVKLRGAAIHHDNGVIGAHTLDAAEDRRVRILKAAGFNAIRSAHNPASRALLRACDLHGMYVMDELTDVWYNSKTTNDYSKDFEKWWEADLESLVTKDLNHPSVIMYSIGNEISETSQARGIELGRRIAARARHLDPSRLTTNAINGFFNLIAPSDTKRAKSVKPAKEGDEHLSKSFVLILNLLMGVMGKVFPLVVRLPGVDKKTRDAYASVEVAGYNYMQVRYRGDARRYPKRVVVGSETDGASLARSWSLIQSQPHVIGEFVWTGWDYIGEAGVASTAYDAKPSFFHPYPALLAGEPFIDITGYAQTQAVQTQFLWLDRQRPHIAVRPANRLGQKARFSMWRVTDSVPSWSWPGYEGRRLIVEVYANAPRVDILLNGELVQSRTVGKAQEFKVEVSIAYAHGELTVIAYNEQGVEMSRSSLTSASDQLQLNVTPELAELRADGADLAYIPIEITDETGVLQPLSDREVTVLVEGHGALLGLGSGQPVTTEGFTSATHSTYYGRALAVIRSGHEEGTISVTVTAEGCNAVTVRIPVRTTQDRPLEGEPAVLRGGGSSK